MLLCKQPGESGVFATATPERINIYSLFIPPRIHEETAAATNAGIDTLEAERLGVPLASAANDFATGPRRFGASRRMKMAGVAVEGRWGSPLPPSYVIPFSMLRGSEGGAEGGAVRGEGISIPRREPRMPARDGADPRTCVPLSLSISSAQHAIQFFVSDSAGGAWVGVCDGVDGTLSLFHNISTRAGDVASSSSGGGCSGSYCGSSGIGMRHDAAFHNGDVADIVTSGWDPRSAAVLAVGRRDGVLQLLDMESGGLPGYSTCTMGLATADHLGGNDSSPVHLSTPQSRIGGLRCSRVASMPSVVQERVVQGSVTSLDWVPRSHMTVLAARRPDGMGCYVEVMDLRTPESGIRYFGAPSGAIALPQHHHNSHHSHHRQHLVVAAGSSFPPLCCAELVASDESQRYVATVGSHNHRDVVQLWDLRMTSRPVSSHVCSHAGYTSLSWSACDVPTVLGTTRSGELRMHVFTDAHRTDGNDNGDDDDDDDEEEERRVLPGTEEEEEDDDEAAPVSSVGTMMPFWATKRVTKPSEERCRLHTCVPAASALWLAGRCSLARPPQDVEAMATDFSVGESKRTGGGGQCNTSRHVDCGRHTNLPCILLLNARTGELYPQVFSPKGSTTTMLGDLPLCAAGLNVFLLIPEKRMDPLSQHYSQQQRKQEEHRQYHQLQQKQQRQRLHAEEEGMRDNEVGGPCSGLEVTSPTDNSVDSLSMHDMFDSNSEAERADRLPSNSLQGEATRSRWPNASLSNTTDAAASLKALMGTVGVSSVDRTWRRLERLRSGFLTRSHKVFAVLLQEGIDREAYVLFRYGWYVQRYLHQGKPAVPTGNFIPGLLELLQRERHLTASPSPSLPLPPQQQHQQHEQQQEQVREIILRAMGWCVDKREEQLMLAEPDGDAGNAVTSPRSCTGVSPTLHTPLPRQQQQPDRGALVSPKSLSRASVDESVDSIFRLAPPLHCGFPASLPTVLEPCDRVETASLQEAVERRAAILVCMGQLKDAALLLSRCSSLHPLYSSVALVLSAAATHNNIPAAASSFEISGCSYWLKLCMALVLEIQAHIPVFTDAGEVNISSKRDVGNDSGNIRGSNWLSRLSLETRREYFNLFTRRFPRLPLSDRIALATVLLLLPQQQEQCIVPESSGDPHLALIEVLQEMMQQQFDSTVTTSCSILLAAAVEGLHHNCISLQRYVDQTCDVQTPLVYVGLYGPAKGTTWRCWNDAYRSQLNADGHVFLRSHHDLSCIKMAQLRAGVSDTVKGSTLPLRLGNFDGLSPPAANLIGGSFGGLGGGVGAEAKTNQPRRGKRSVELKCKCGSPIATVPPTMDDEAATGCHKRDLCSSPSCMTPMCTVCGERMFSRAGVYTIDQCFTWCTICLHGGHWAHLRDWFAKHRACPAEDCPCPCYHPSFARGWAR